VSGSERERCATSEVSEVRRVRLGMAMDPGHLGMAMAPGRLGMATQPGAKGPIRKSPGLWGRGIFHPPPLSRTQNSPQKWGGGVIDTRVATTPPTHSKHSPQSTNSLRPLVVTSHHCLGSLDPALPPVYRSLDPALPLVYRSLDPALPPMYRSLDPALALLAPGAP